MERTKPKPEPETQDSRVETEETPVDSGPLGQLVSDKLGREETSEPPSELEPAPAPRATSDDYAEGTAEHDDDDDV